MPGPFDISSLMGGLPQQGGPQPQNPIPGVPPEVLAALRQRLLGQGGMAGLNPQAQMPPAGAPPGPPAAPLASVLQGQVGGPPPGPPAAPAAAPPMAAALPQAGNPDQLAAAAGAMPAPSFIDAMTNVARRSREPEPRLPEPDEKRYVDRLRRLMKAGLITPDEHRRMANDPRQFASGE